jgi:predicted DNA-binding transcriptional regulator AlpA
MRADRAAAYIGVSTRKFLQLVDDGRMPQPVRIDGAVTWDRLDLDRAYDRLKDGQGEQSTGRKNRLLELLGEDDDDHET